MFSESLPAHSDGSRNIVICCDGTGNEFGNENSNVVKLYQTLMINHDQLGYYHPGVGTMGAPTAHWWLEKEWSRIKGLAFGAGLMANVGDAYRYLMNTYRDGDRIFIFGFSRGAYTARVLAGVLHVCGLLCPGNDGLIPYVTRLFAQQSRKQPAKSHLPVAEQFKAAFSRDVLIDFVGLWDTVSSVGWIYDPVVLPFEGRNPIIRVGRHALAIDERRCFYRDKLWGRPFRPGDSGFRVEQDIKQVWFAGVHSDIGGSYPEEESGLSKVALEWMLSEAARFGLRISLPHAAEVLGRVQPPASPVSYMPPDPLACLHDSLRGGWWALEYLPHSEYDKRTKTERWSIPRGAWRFIPEASRIHSSVFERKEGGKDYNPPNLPAKYDVEPRISFPQPEPKAPASDAA